MPGISASRYSLSLRLTGWYTVTTLVLLASATGLLYWVLTSDQDRDSDLFLADKVNVVASILCDRPEDYGALREEIELESAARRNGQFYIRLLDERGTEVLNTPGMAESLPGVKFSSANSRKGSVGKSLQAENGHSFRVLAASLPVGRSAEKFWRMQIAVVGHRIARRGMRPIEQIATTARRISSSTLNERIKPAGYPIEVITLADTFNAMLDRLEDSFAQLSAFSADIAHELRTPVNNIRGEAEVALSRARSAHEYREVVGSCLEEAVRLSELIAKLLFLARVESPGTHLKRETTELSQVLQAVHEYFEPAATEAQVQLLTECPEGLCVSIDQSLLRRAIANLVSNALNHTPAGGTVTMRVREEKNSIRVEVQDSGVGIPADALPRVFDRFFRVDRARSGGSGGTGLGLAIVKSILSLHEGTAEVQSVVGVGTTVILKVPLGPLLRAAPWSRP